MKILFVLECAGLMTNGTTASCIRFANELEKRGHVITVIGCKSKDGTYLVPNYVELPHYKFPFFESLINKEGFEFVKVDDVALYNIIKEQDCIHLFLPFKFASHARLIANKLGIAVTAAFHLQPDTITSSIHISNPFFNGILYRSFKRYLYDRVDLIHCPSKMIEDELKKYKYKGRTCVISNGISDFWHKVDAKKEEKFKDKFVITMVGRLADEKRQDTLIKALRLSKHEKDIQLVLCGSGPNEEKYLKMFKKYKFTNEPEIRFLSQEDLRCFLSSIDLYIHCSDAEIEGLSCVEAFSCGLVPVISDSSLSATKSFALKEESLYKKGDASDLAKKIDYWFENDSIRKEYSLKYQELSKKYALSIQVEKFEQFFIEAIKIKMDNQDIATIKKSRKDIRQTKKIIKTLKKNGIDI